MILKLFLLLIITLIKFSIGCETFPNGTDEKIHWFRCPDSGEVVFHSLVTVDENNNEEYPIRLKQPVYAIVNMDNNGETYSSIRLDLALYRWGGWQGCSWHKIPTFGLLSNKNACKSGVPCPILSGKNQNVTFTIDFTKYSLIVGLLKNDAPYQLMYKLTDRVSGRTTCTMIQARSLTKH
uniref:ML domain-containing protein n=1 Tax=Strongyloides venezuelensis TaxID=75913 RepID=A0A0K0FTS4_STRVS